MRSKALQAALVGTVIAIGAGAVVAQQPAQQQQQTGQPAGGQQAGRGGRGNSVQIKEGEECPAGMTMTRPGTCQAPQFPPPSIVDYRPRSTLVTPAHPTQKAKFPVIDYHGHTGGRLNTPEGIA